MANLPEWEYRGAEGGGERLRHESGRVEIDIDRTEESEWDRDLEKSVMVERFPVLVYEAMTYDEEHEEWIDYGMVAQLGMPDSLWKARELAFNGVARIERDERYLSLPLDANPFEHTTRGNYDQEAQDILMDAWDEAKGLHPNASQEFLEEEYAAIAQSKVENAEGFRYNVLRDRVQHFEEEGF